MGVSGFTSPFRLKGMGGTVFATNGPSSSLPLLSVHELSRVMHTYVSHHDTSV
jgi:hypothetical protein